MNNHEHFGTEKGFLNKTPLVQMLIPKITKWDLTTLISVTCQNIPPLAKSTAYKMGEDIYSTICPVENEYPKYIKNKKLK